MSVSDAADVRLTNKSLYLLGQLLFVMEQFHNNSQSSICTGGPYLAKLGFGERIALVGGDVPETSILSSADDFVASLQPCCAGDESNDVTVRHRQRTKMFCRSAI